MANHDQLKSTIDIEQLLLTKRLEPLAAHFQQKLQKVAALDVTNFSEEEVRSYIIDPIVEALGYEKGTVFEANLEHSVTFVGHHIRPDYQLTLWNENFWLIEAKKPRLNKAAFEQTELRQAVEYSIHPTINAALVVLCDGVKLEIFDREVSVDIPLLRVEIKSLPAEFDKVRAVLEPMQVWFFQKRRVVRLIDKVFDNEFNMARVEEFGKLVEGRLRSKQQIVLENFRKAPKPDENDDLKFIAGAQAVELVEMFFFFDRHIPATNAMIRRLVDLSVPNSFAVMHRIFPDKPRDVSDQYMAHALAYLMELGAREPEAWWMPSWLTRASTDKKSIDEAIRYFLRQCLTYFADHEAFRAILLASNALRRIAKIYAVGSDAVRTAGATMHAFARHELPEMSWSQFLVSPEGQLIAHMDAAAMTATKAFVQRNSGENHTFKIESARQEIRAMWGLEEHLLKSLGNYAKLSRERSLGELRVTEWSSVTYDNLGHLALVFVDHNPVWENITLSEHLPEVEKLAALGSWSGRRLLDIPQETNIKPLDDVEIAERFFFGNVQTLTSLRGLYRGDIPTPPPAKP